MKRFFKYFCFYLVQLTWGLPLNIIGGISVFIAWITGEKVYRCGPFIYAYSKYLHDCAYEGGIFIMIGYNCESCLPHESGHALQNMVFGWLMPFIICIPSAIRFWYREILVKSGKKKYNELPAYDSIWFEGSATKYGTKVFGEKWKQHLLNRK